MYLVTFVTKITRVFESERDVYLNLTLYSDRVHESLFYFLIMKLLLSRFFSDGFSNIDQTLNSKSGIHQAHGIYALK